VSVVQLDPVGAEHQLPKRVRRVELAPIGPPYTPPVIRTLTPVSGPSGGTVRMAGEHLAGWRLSVTVAGREVVDERPLTGDTAEFTLPAGLAPGFHQVRADVSRLARASWFFEVI
jgi:hypothetical protein